MIRVFSNASVAFDERGPTLADHRGVAADREAIAAWIRGSMGMSAFWAAAAVLAVTVVARTIYSWVRWAR